MSATQRQIRIPDDQEPTEPSLEDVDVDFTGDGDIQGVDLEVPSHYADAGEPDWSKYGRQTAAFVKALLPELEKSEFVDDRSHVHHYAQLEQLRLVDDLDRDATDDVDLAVLFALPDESLLFVGADPTARETTGLFGYVVEPFDPIPAPASAQDALDLLRPADVQDAFAEGETPDRQGEWWLLPTLKVPVSTVHQPGVRSKPYGPSPLDSHVPREWATTVPDDQFVANVREIAPALPASITTPAEVVAWVRRQHRKNPTPEVAPDWSDVWSAGGDLLVRGTLRHRDDEHYVEHLGDEWHRALTHDMDVYTADEFGTVVLD